jgi:hypothetical protein
MTASSSHLAHAFDENSRELAKLGRSRERLVSGGDGEPSEVHETEGQPFEPKR